MQVCVYKMEEYCLPNASALSNKYSYINIHTFICKCCLLNASIQSTKHPCLKFQFRLYISISVISGSVMQPTFMALGTYIVLGVFRTYSEHCGLLAEW